MSEPKKHMMEACQITTDAKRRIILVKAPFSKKDELKEIPGARWMQDKRVWTFPLSGAAAGALVEALKTCNCTTDRAFDDLVEISKIVERSSCLKESDSLEQPPIRKTDAWGHQKCGYHFATSITSRGGGAMLAMDMGTGKSKVAIDVISNMEAGDPPGKAVLILCPVSVIAAWPKQFSIHAPDEWRCLPLVNNFSTEKRASMVMEEFEHWKHKNIAVIVNYEAAWRPALAKTLMSVRWDAIIADESHRIKAPSGKASVFMGKIANCGKRRFALTGTPLPHSPLDAYGQYRFLDPGIFGQSFTRFRSRYAIMGGFQNYQVVGFRNEAEFNQKFYSIAYRVGAEVLDLPEAVHVTRECTLEPAAKKLYKELESSLVAEIEGGEVTVANALTKLLRLQQVAGGHVKDDEGNLREVSSSKKTLLRDILEDLAEDEPVVVFGRFRTDLDQVHEVARTLGRDSLELSGRVNELSDWQNGKATILAVQIQAGGSGIDLTRARYCLYFSKGFSLGDYQQSLKRTHRPGQTRNVVYIHLITAGTVDARVEKALEERREIVDFVLGSFDATQKEESA